MSKSDQQVKSGGAFNIRQALAGAGVSQNAFYTLARKRNILPQSILTMADFLGVAPSDLLDAGCSTVEKASRLGAAVDVLSNFTKMWTVTT